ncbi:MAG: hypothetical protein K0R31_762, partial [Clostridiales bacterium]|nr:hypothetical protein [Clostridiales bacterium]
YHDITGTPKAVNGGINLTAVSPADGEIYLDGQWEFYWNRFITTESEQLSNQDMIIAVPDSWSNYDIDGKRLSAEGYASYKLTLRDLKYDKPITLSIQDFSGAYRAFIDGQLAAESGTVSKDIGMIFTVPKADLYPVTLPQKTTHEVVIEVATTRFSGLYMTPVLSDYHRTVDDNSFRNVIRFILFGIVLFSFLCLIAVYTLSIRRKLYSLWLPVMIFFILMRIMLTSEFYSIWQPVLFFNLSYESTNELMYFTTFVLKYLLLFLVQEQCGIPFSKQEKRGFLLYYILLYIIYLFVPQSIYNQYLSVLVPMLTYVLDVYLFIKIYRGRQTLKKFGMVVFWGAALIITGLTIDSYYINGKVYMNMSLTLQLLFTVFALIMSWVYALRMGDLYDDFTKSSSRLELANSQIAVQKEYYEALSGQMNEIREMKHDIRHFIGVMSRLAEENRFEELKVFLGEYGEKTEFEQLPVFCENTIANSIIGYYHLRAKESGIPFESRCNIGKKIAIRDSDLCIVLGNALENAITACKQIDNSDMRFISIEAGRIKGQRLFKIVNSYSGRLVIKDGRCVSSKEGKSHGLGIRNIEKVIDAYGGFVRIEHNEKEFTLMAAVKELLG